MCSVAFPVSPNHFIVPKGYFFKPYVFILEVFIGCQAFFYVEIEIPSDFFLTLFINRVGHHSKTVSIQDSVAYRSLSFVVTTNRSLTSVSVQLLKRIKAIKRDQNAVYFLFFGADRCLSR